MARETPLRKGRFRVGAGLDGGSGPAVQTRPDAQQDLPHPVDLREPLQLLPQSRLRQAIDDRGRGRRREEDRGVGPLLAGDDLLRIGKHAGGGEERQPVGIGPAIPVPRQPESGAAGELGRQLFRQSLQ
jgi:hypothetical protein